MAISVFATTMSNFCFSLIAAGQVPRLQHDIPPPLANGHNTRCVHSGDCSGPDLALLNVRCCLSGSWMLSEEISYARIKLMITTFLKIPDLFKPIR